MPASRRITNAEKYEQTRRRLLDVARREFGEKGFACASTSTIVSKAKVTRGALYYHFTDKKALFRSVVDAIHELFMQRLYEAEGSVDDLWQDALIGCNIYLDMCLNPEFRQIILIDAPAVLGFAECRQIDDKYMMGYLQKRISTLIEHGILPEQDTQALSNILIGAFDYAGMAIATSDNKEQTRDIYAHSLLILLNGMRLKSH